MREAVKQFRGRFETLIRNSQIEQAIDHVRDLDLDGWFVLDKFEASIFTAFDYHQEYPEIAEAILESFFKARKSDSIDHEHWVHSLSHFTDYLWEHTLDEWIKRFNKAAFEGDLEFNGNTCSDRLASDFFEHASWEDDPRDFKITLDVVDRLNLEWSELDSDYLKDRIRAESFESKDSFLHWLIQQAKDSVDKSDQGRLQAVAKKAWRLVNSDTRLTNEEARLLKRLKGVIENKSHLVSDESKQRSIKASLGGIEEDLEL